MSQNNITETICELQVSFIIIHSEVCIESSLYYGLSGVISTVIIVLVCVAIIYHTLVKGEVCVCVCDWCCIHTVSCLTGKTSTTSATSVSATEMISTDTNPSYGQVQYPTSTHKTTTPVYDSVKLFYT